MALLTFRQFSLASGYSEQAIARNIKRGFWKVGRGAAKEKAVLRVRNGITMICENAFDRWVTKFYRRAASRKAWGHTNAGKVTAYTRARQASQIQRTPPWADLDAIKDIYEQANRVSLDTGIKHHVDHIVPLRGKTVSGLHVPWNLRIILATDNVRKSNKLCS